MIDLATDAINPALIVVAMARDGQLQLCITDEEYFADGGCPVAAAKAGWQAGWLIAMIDTYVDCCRHNIIAAQWQAQ